MNWQSVKTFAAPAQMSRHHKHRLDDGDRGHRSVYQVILGALKSYCLLEDTVLEISQGNHHPSISLSQSERARGRCTWRHQQGV
jgi:hypothetical protein